MKIFSEVIGNMTTDSTWVEKLKNAKIEYLNLDQWTAQKSRFIAKGTDGTDYAVALKRHSQIENGDILEYDAIGNQHWPAIVKGTTLYIPLTVDKKVMTSVMDTHHFEDITYEFQSGLEVIPFLAPHEIRKLFGGSSQDVTHHHEHVHDHGITHDHEHSHDHGHDHGHVHPEQDASRYMHKN